MKFIWTSFHCPLFCLQCPEKNCFLLHFPLFLLWLHGPELWKDLLLLLLVCPERSTKGCRFQTSHFHIHNGAEKGYFPISIGPHRLRYSLPLLSDWTDHFLCKVLVYPDCFLAAVTPALKMMAVCCSKLLVPTVVMHDVATKAFSWRNCFYFAVFIIQNFWIQRVTFSLFTSRAWEETVCCDWNIVSACPDQFLSSVVSLVPVFACCGFYVLASWNRELSVEFCASMLNFFVPWWKFSKPLSAMSPLL